MKNLQEKVKKNIKIGILKEPNGTYEGLFMNGEKNGNGTYHFNNQITYEGNYLNGFKHGKGKIINSNKIVSYEGEFKNGLPHGKGSIPTNQGNIEN
jgi:hypothetical protein